jgi:hypothetical protein
MRLSSADHLIAEPDDVVLKSLQVEETEGDDAFW